MTFPPNLYQAGVLVLVAPNSGQKTRVWLCQNQIGFRFIIYGYLNRPVFPEAHLLESGHHGLSFLSLLIRLFQFHLGNVSYGL